MIVIASSRLDRMKEYRSNTIEFASYREVLQKRHKRKALAEELTASL